MRTIILLRHPQVANYTDRVYNGSYDVGITAKGARQFLKIGRFLAKHYKPEIIFSSDLVRAKAGAYFISRFTKAPVVFKEGLRERNMGVFESKSWEQIVDLYPSEAKEYLNNPLNFKPKGAESLIEQRQRVEKAFFSILSTDRRNLAVVAHGGTNRIILSIVKGISLEKALEIHQDYGCINIIEQDKGKFFLIEENNTNIYESF